MDAAVIRRMVKESREYFMTGDTLKVSTRFWRLWACITASMWR